MACHSHQVKYFQIYGDYIYRLIATIASTQIYEGIMVALVELGDLGHQLPGFHHLLISSSHYRLRNRDGMECANMLKLVDLSDVLEAPLQLPDSFRLVA